MARYLRYVAIGDSTTEGLDDPDGRGGFRGWANRLAEKLAALEPHFQYANLAVRGLVARQIRARQLAHALELKPDVATVVAGMNDLLRPRFNARAIGQELRAMISPLRALGTEVLTFTLPDLTPVMPLARPLRARGLALAEEVRGVASDTGARLVDFASVPVASDPRLWSDDRLHANSLGHSRIADALAEALGIEGSNHSWVEPLNVAAPRSTLEFARAEWAWSRRHLFPWLARHLRGASSSDARVAKRPQLAPLDSP